MSDSRRDFLKKAALLAGATSFANIIPASIQKQWLSMPRQAALIWMPNTLYIDAGKPLFRSYLWYAARCARL